MIALPTSATGTRPTAAADPAVRLIRHLRAQARPVPGAPGVRRATRRQRGSVCLSLTLLPGGEELYTATRYQPWRDVAEYRHARTYADGLALFGAYLRGPVCPPAAPPPPFPPERGGDGADEPAGDDGELPTGDPPAVERAWEFILPGRRIPTAGARRVSPETAAAYEAGKAEFAAVLADMHSRATDRPPATGDPSAHDEPPFDYDEERPYFIQ